MTTSYLYPTNSELQLIAQEKLPVLTMDDPIFRLMPIVDVDAYELAWEQTDNYKGLQQVRGLNGQPGNVTALGGNQFRMKPGVYGEFMTIDEEELTTRRQWGTFATPINLTDLVTLRQDQLLQRRIDLMRYVGWTLLATGTFSVANNRGVIHTDSFPVQSTTALIPWATSATATPIANFRAIKLLARGRSVSFGAQATAYMNQVTFNNMITNRNDADLHGSRTSGLGTVLSVAQTNAVLQQEDLPQIEIYDDGYIDDSDDFQLFIPDGKVVIAGRRAGGQTIMDYAMTRNANNSNLAPGAYMKVVDYVDERVPRTIEVHDGHNGGPRLYHPSAIVHMTVA
jgi:hypothetical protein